MSYRLPQNGKLVYRQSTPKSFQAMPGDGSLEQTAKILSRDEPKWIELNSENVQRVSYDPDTLILKAIFHNTDTEYRYYGVSQRVFDGLPEAKSPTAYLQRWVIPNHKVRRATRHDNKT